MFRIGASVYATDGMVGKLKYVILDPRTREVSDLVIESGTLFKRARVVSARHVARVDDEGALHLSVDKEYVRSCRIFRHEEFATPAWAPETEYDRQAVLIWSDPYAGPTLKEMPRPITRLHIDQGVDEHVIVVGKGSEVYTRLGERVGSIDHIAIDPDTRKPRYLVVRLNGIRRRRVVVPVEQVKAWQHHAVVLDLTRKELRALPPYTPRTPDLKVAEAVRAAIEALGIDVGDLNVFVDKGHVLLRGHTHTLEERRRVEMATRAVEGVVSVVNEVTTDRELELRVQERLLRDAVAGLYPVDLMVQNRVATIIGTVPNEAIAQIIRDIVRQTPGITSVIDQLSIDPTAFREEPLPVVVMR